MDEQFKCLGVIPARGGSKTIPKKNIYPINGKPLIAYTIAAANDSKELFRAIVSTDCPEIAEHAKQHGGTVPFSRPAEIAQDTTPDRPVLVHAAEWFKSEYGAYPDMVALLRPTTPFKTGAIIDGAVKLLKETGADSVRSVSAVEGVHHPYWMFVRDASGKAQPVVPGVSIDKYFQRQLLPPVYRLNGVVEVIKTDVLLHHAKLYGDDMRLYEVPEAAALDIDSLEDLALCELRFKNNSRGTS